VVKWVHVLLMPDLMEVLNGMLLCPQKQRFYFHFPFAWPIYAGFLTNLYFFLFSFWEIKGLNSNVSITKRMFMAEP